MNASSLVQKVWNFCHTLRDDGVGYGDYLEQLTYLLFLKLAHEYAQEPYNRDTHVPKGYDWASLTSKVGEPLEAHYLATLHRLGQEPGMLGAIFFKAQNKIQDPAKLSRLVQLIDAESWISLDADTKGDLYEGLLQKNAEDTKSGAGQYFTPRALIEAMVACVRPEPMKTIADPACGTGGFFLGAYNWLTRPGAKLDRRQKEFLRDQTFHGNEIVPSTRRMCLMNPSMTCRHPMCCSRRSSSTWRLHLRPSGMWPPGCSGTDAGDQELPRTAGRHLLVGKGHANANGELSKHPECPG